MCNLINTRARTHTHTHTYPDLLWIARQRAVRFGDHVRFLLLAGFDRGRNLCKVLWNREIDQSGPGGGGGRIPRLRQRARYIGGATIRNYKRR